MIDPITLEVVKNGLSSLADEMADITMLQAHMESLSDDISKLLGSVDVSDAAKERVLTGSQLTSLVKLDYEKVLSQRAAWNARFEREIATIK